MSRYCRKVKPASLIRLAERDCHNRYNETKMGTTNPNHEPGNGKPVFGQKQGKRIKTSPFCAPKRIQNVPRNRDFLDIYHSFASTMRAAI